jgi:hypothetical protein
MYEHLHDPQSIPLCLLCDQHEQHREDGLCAHCAEGSDAAEHNRHLAELADRAQLTSDDVDRFVYDMPPENERESLTARVLAALDYAAGGAR